MTKSKASAPSSSVLFLPNMSIRSTGSVFRALRSNVCFCVCATRAAGSFYRVRQRQGRLHHLQRPRQPDENHGLHADWNGADRIEPEHQHEPWATSIQYRHAWLFVDFISICLTFQEAASGSLGFSSKTPLRPIDQFAGNASCHSRPWRPLAGFAFLFSSSWKYRTKWSVHLAAVKQIMQIYTCDFWNSVMVSIQWVTHLWSLDGFKNRKEDKIWGKRVIK